MIEEIRIKNFLSFRDEVVFHFKADKDRSLRHKQVVEVSPKTALTRFHLVLGANASGKSNLLAAILFLRRFWCERKRDAFEPTGAIPFLLDKESPREPTEINLRFYAGDKRYGYSLILDERQVLREDLYIYNSAQPSALFHRVTEEGASVITFNRNLVRYHQREIDEISARCLPNMSFFAARSEVNCSLMWIDQARDWARGTIMPMTDPREFAVTGMGPLLERHLGMKEEILSLLSRAGTDITDIHAERIASLRREEEPTFRVSLQHTARGSKGIVSSWLPFQRESEGVKRMIGLAALLLASLKKESVLCLDGIEQSLHPDLIELFLERFLATPEKSQLIVATHYDPLLNNVDELFRKDAVWFTEKGKDGATRLYPLLEFNRLSKIPNFQKAYRKGLFGALPEIQDRRMS